MAIETEVPGSGSAAAETPAGRRGVSSTIFRLAWPVVVERLSLSVLSGVDAALVGHYVGAHGVAAVGLGSLMFWIVLSGAIAVDVGATAIIARDAGAGDISGAALGMRTAIAAGLAWGVTCMVALILLAPLLVRAMGAEGDVRGLGVEYMRFGALGFPMMMALYAISGSLRGLGNTWMPMLILILVNLVNAGVTFLLISGVVADLGVRASGIGYGAAGTTGGVVALGLVVSGVAPVRIALPDLLRVPRFAYARLLRVGLPVGLEEAQFMLAFLVYTSIIARLGTTQLAAHSIALRSNELAILPGFALGTAATTMVGQRLGAGRALEAEDIAKRARFFAICGACVMGAIQIAFAPQILRIFVSDPDVVETGAKLLRVFAFAQPALAIHGSLSGALRGAGDVRFVLGTFTATAWGIRVPMAAAMVLIFGLSAPFAWLAAVTENWTRAGLVSRRFRQGHWKRMRV